MIYRKLLRPILYLFPPEIIHKVVAYGGNFILQCRILRKIVRNFLLVKDVSLQQNYFDINFHNPVGLAAGFDKEADHVSFDTAMGFSFVEIGSITDQPYAGNPGPHIRRLVKSQALVINYGLKNSGAAVVSQNLAKLKSVLPFGISIAKSNVEGMNLEQSIDDVLNAYEKLAKYGYYHTINTSCPNVCDTDSFINPENLIKLFERINEFRKKYNIKQPLFVKVYPDIDENQIAVLAKLHEVKMIDGVIIGNLLKDKPKVKSTIAFPEEYDVNWAGGVSGQATKDISTACIKKVYARTQGQLLIIGCGGIFDGQDAYEKIRAGASLLQLVTGFIFGGPLAIRRINKELIGLLKKDGYSSISDCIGLDAK